MNISMVKPVVIVNGLRATCKMTREDFISGQMAHERSLTKNKMVKRGLMEITTNNIAGSLNRNDTAQKVGERVGRIC